MPNQLRRRLQAPKPRGILRDILTIVLADGRALDVQRVRHPRAKRLTLSVDECGARLTLPPRASLVAGARFLGEHRDWLATQIQLHAIDGIGALAPDETTALPLRGDLLPLRWQDGGCIRLQRDGDGLCFCVPARTEGPALRHALRDFYQSEARVDVRRWLAHYLPTLPRSPRRVLLKPMSSQWGSLAQDDTLALDLALVLGRPSAFEYVLVHELCHLIRADHSPAFWRAVEARFPRWRAERDYFHAEGRRLKASLRALTAG